MITKKDWSEWKTSDVTKALIAALVDKREAIKEGLVEESFGDEYLKYVGRAQALGDTIYFIMEEWKQDLEDTDGN